MEAAPAGYSGPMVIGTASPGNMTRVLAALFGVWCAVSCAHPAAEVNGLSATDERAIRAVDSSYVAAWLRDDTTGVIATLAPNAVLMPAGHHPLSTLQEIRAFWWPQDGSHTKILTFNRVIDELGGVGDMAFTRGTDTLTFSYGKGSQPTR